MAEITELARLRIPFRFTVYIRKNHLTDIVPLPTPGGSCTTTSSSDVSIANKTPTNPSNLPPASVYFTTQTEKRDKPTYLSPVITLQLGPDVTHVE